MKRVMVVFGTRPEAIKMAPVIQALEAHPELEPYVCVTAQHRQMLDHILALFGITPDHDLNLMQPGQDLASLTARIIERLTPVIEAAKPDALLVQGDTTTTFCAALAAFYAKVPVGHIEAGLRTGDKHAPFPEEINRLLTTRLADWHFAPTANNREALLKEGVDAASVHITGNTVIDALLWMKEHLHQGYYQASFADLATRFTRPFILVTGHRRESFGTGFENICQALRQLASNHPELDFIYPVHLNPNVQEPVRRILSEASNIHLIEPQGYESFVYLMDQAHLVLTDSGGVQEEAPSLGKPVLVMRDKTERTEGLDAGVRLVGTSTAKIVAECERLLTDQDHYRAMSEAANPYGDGKAAERIVDLLARHL